MDTEFPTWGFRKFKPKFQVFHKSEYMFEIKAFITILRSNFNDELIMVLRLDLLKLIVYEVCTVT